MNINYGSITNRVGNITFNNRYKLQFVEQTKINEKD